jgi:hypothetical protein
MLSAWKHSGFHVFCGNRISPNDDTAMKNGAITMTDQASKLLTDENVKKAYLGI